MITTVNDYIAQFPKRTQAKLQQVRRAIHRSAPGATETIRYGIPTFQILGKNLVHFAGWTTHVGFYPSPSGISAFQAELGPYELSRGTVKFPMDEPMPLALIQRITKFRLAEVKALVVAKKRKK